MIFWQKVYVYCPRNVAGSNPAPTFKQFWEELFQPINGPDIEDEYVIVIDGLDSVNVDNFKDSWSTWVDYV